MVEATKYSSLVAAEALLDEALRPTIWTPAADRFTKGRLETGRAIHELYPEPHAKPIVALAEAVRDSGHEIAVEYAVTGNVTEKLGVVRFMAAPVHEDSRIVGVRMSATRPGGIALYASNAPHALAEGAFATLVTTAYGLPAADAVAVSEIRTAAREATRDALRPLLTSIRRAALAGRPRSPHGLPQLPPAE